MIVHGNLGGLSPFISQRRQKNFKDTGDASSAVHHLTRDGNFNTKTTYSNLLRSSIVDRRDQWAWIWKTETYPRSPIFHVDMLSWEKLPTTSQFRARDLNVLERRWACSSLDKGINHILLISNSFPTN